MKRRILAVLVLWGSLAGVALSGGKTALIELNDGSTVRGEIVSLVDGVYTVQSSDLGALTIDQSKVRGVRIGSAVEAGTTAAVPPKPTKAGRISIGEQVDVLRQTMAGNEELMSMVGSLAEDPDFQAVLRDPEIMTAVNSGDLNTLLANPRFMELLNKATVRDITGRATK